MITSRRSFYTFRTLMFLAIPLLGDNQFICKDIMRVFRREDQRQDCSCVEPTIPDCSYYRCDTSDERCFRCLNSSVTISEKAVCDNVVDCPDLSDELLCFEKRKYDPVDPCRLNMEDIFWESDERQLDQKLSFACGVSNSWKFILTCGTLENDRYEKLFRQEITTEDSSTQMNRSPIHYCSDINDGDFANFECYDDTTCDPEDSLMAKDRALLVIGTLIGTTAIFMNAAVIFMTIKCIYKNRTRLTQEERLTKSFFLSLSISDVMVAICITISSTALQAHESARSGGLHQWISSCDAVGTFSLIGSEQSVFTMVLITLSRIWGIARPFSRMPMKTFLVSLSLCWAMSIIIAVIPLMKTFEDTFVTTLWQKEAPFLRYVTQKELLSVTDFLRQHSTKRIELSRPKGSWAELRDLVDEIFGIEFYKKGFYQGHHKCLVDLFQTRESKARVYSLIIFTTNAASFFFMMFGYCYIFMKQQRGLKKQNIPAAEEESEKLKRKIFYILATDFVCWIPVCIYGFIVASADVLRWSVNQDLYFTATYILLPINSVANPIIYSGAPDYLHQKLVSTRKKWKCASEEPDRGKSPDVALTIPMTVIDNVSVSAVSNFSIDRC